MIVNNSTKSVIDLLRQLGVEDEFVNEVPETINLKHIPTILKAYDKWLYSKMGKAV